GSSGSPAVAFARAAWNLPDLPVVDGETPVSRPVRRTEGMPTGVNLLRVGREKPAHPCRPLPQTEAHVNAVADRRNVHCEAARVKADGRSGVIRSPANQPKGRWILCSELLRISPVATGLYS